MKFGVWLSVVEKGDGYVAEMEPSARCKLGAQPGLYACYERAPVCMEKIDDAVQELWWKGKMRQGHRLKEHSVKSGANLC